MNIYLDQNIRLLRKRNGWSQEELAEHLSLNRGNIASYEKGTAQPRICNLIKLSKLFKVSIMDLLMHDLTHVKNPCQISSPSSLSAEDQKSVELIQSHFAEVKDYINGVNSCQQYSLRKFSESETSKEVQYLISNFEQLHQACQLLVKDQEALLNLISQKEKTGA